MVAANESTRLPPPPMASSVSATRSFSLSRSVTESMSEP